jgi:hypothetical protein
MPKIAANAATGVTGATRLGVRDIAHPPLEVDGLWSAEPAPLVAAALPLPPLADPLLPPLADPLLPPLETPPPAPLAPVPIDP